MTTEILCVGTEILLGDIVNTNAQYIAKELAVLGINVYRQSVVGDNAQRLKESLALALSRADTVVMTGGLGPTYDDLTKETVAEFFGRGLVVHEPSLRQIEDFFQKTGRTMTENNRKMAMVPERAVVFPNPCGQAPGMVVEGEGELSGKRCVMMPGPPREMTAVLHESVLPYLAFGSDHKLVSKSVHIFGMGESAVEDRLRDKMIASKNPTIAPYAKTGEVMLRITAAVTNDEEADRLIDPVIEEITAALDPGVVYGIDVESLENALVLALKAKNLTVATAESCTAGLLSSRITGIPGASGVFHCGVSAYAGFIKERVLGVSPKTLTAHGEVSAACAAEMAQGVRKLSGATIGLSITGIAGPDGGTPDKPVGLVYVGVDSEWLTETLTLHLARPYRSSQRELIRLSAASHALFLGLRAVALAP